MVGRNMDSIFCHTSFAIRIGELLLQVLGQHALHIMRGRVEPGLDDRLDAALAKNPGDSFRDEFESGCGR